MMREEEPYALYPSGISNFVTMSHKHPQLLVEKEHP